MNKRNSAGYPLETWGDNWLHCPYCKFKHPGRAFENQTTWEWFKITCQGCKRNFWGQVQISREYLGSSLGPEEDDEPGRTESTD